MRKTFICSLCRGGIIGGALYLDDTALTYKTNKLTVAEEYRNIRMPLNEITELSWQQIVFPIATFKMINGKEFKFIIYNKKRFNKYYTNE
jgi:hypothetical protein